ncbi:phage holin family protein [Undibacterium sp. RuRC25W]|uniref:phage holin family protein n=1 Tax=Undibacterium sp. RuRC25W TaxID=3413047 RepID=UPI003BF1EF5F
MAILDSVGQLLATSLSIVHTRLELASVEIEEELGRFFSLLLWSLVALFCACFALVLLAVLLIAVFWDNHRIVVVASMISTLFAVALGLGIWLRSQFSKKPRLLASTLAELHQDSVALRGQSVASKEENS